MLLFRNVLFVTTIIVIVSSRKTMKSEFKDRAAMPKCASCSGPSVCKKVTLVNKYLSQIVEDSPFYSTLLLNDTEQRHVDNVCNTFFRIDSRYLLFRVTVTLDGEYHVQSFIIADIPGQLGAFSLTGLEGTSARVSTEFLIQASSSPQQPEYGFYRCYFLESCTKITAKEDFRFALTSQANPPDELLQASEDALSSPYFLGDSFLRPPQKRPFKCVTRFNGGRCLNSQRIAGQNSLYLPVTS